jgi:hypothetical protein
MHRDWNRRRGWNRHRNRRRSDVGAGAPANSSKIQQRTAATAESFGVNTLKPTTHFYGDAIAGTPVEAGYSNDVDIAAAAVINCVPVGAQADPLGTNNAIKIGTVTNVNANVYVSTGVDCKDKAVSADLWIKAVTGTHTARLRLDNGTETDDLDIVLTTTWQRVKLVAADTVFTSVGNLTYRIFPDPVGGSAEIVVYRPAAVVDTTLWATPALTTRLYDNVTLPVAAGDIPGMRWDRGSVLLDVWNLFDPEDGDAHAYFQVLSGGDFLRLGKWSTDKLLLWIYISSVSQQVDVAVNSVNFARGVAHKLGITYGPTSHNIFLNGVKVATAATTVLGSGTFAAGTVLRLTTSSTTTPRALLSNMKWYGDIQTDAWMIDATT